MTCAAHRQCARCVSAVACTNGAPVVITLKSGGCLEPSYMTFVIVYQQPDYNLVSRAPVCKCGTEDAKRITLVHATSLRARLPHSITDVDVL